MTNYSRWTEFSVGMLLVFADNLYILMCTFFLIIPELKFLFSINKFHDYICQSLWIGDWVNLHLGTWVVNDSNMTQNLIVKKHWFHWLISVHLQWFPCYFTLDQILVTGTAQYLGFWKYLQIHCILFTVSLSQREKNITKSFIVTVQSLRL